MYLQLELVLQKLVFLKQVIVGALCCWFLYMLLLPLLPQLPFHAAFALRDYFLFHSCFFFFFQLQGSVNEQP